MSMPQPSPPDPNVPPPKSGPPSQQTSPGPPPTPSPGRRPPSRPGGLTGGGIAVGVLALLPFLVTAVVLVLGALNVLGPEYTYRSQVGTFVGAAYELSMTVAAIVAALLIFAGNDFGRIFGAGIAGAAMWDAAAWWSDVIGPIVSGEGMDVAYFPWLRAIPAALGGFVGIAALVMLAMPNISTYVANKRDRTPGAPAGSQAPSQAPPPAGQQSYGPPPGQGQAPPPAGQQSYGPPPGQGQAPPPAAQQPYGPPPGQDPRD